MTPETIILQHSQRGMELLHPLLPADFCARAAQRILALPRGNVLIATGFYVGGAAETDGPPGTAALALALRGLGFSPIVVTDEYCEGLFEAQGIPVEYCPVGGPASESLLDKYAPVGVFSVERCGKNEAGDYANMRGISIAAHTAGIDALFLRAAERGILTLGVGDGGNEIGMGNLAEAIRQKLSLTPCVVKTDLLVIASVSNWGAYGLAAWLQRLSGQKLLVSVQWLEEYLAFLVQKGCVDGVSREVSPTVDGYPAGTEQSILRALHGWLENKTK